MSNKTIDSFKRHIKDNLLIYSTVILCFLIGISVGAFTVKIVDKHQKEELFYYLRDFFQLFHNSELDSINIFKQSFINNFQLLALNWLLGALLLTAPLVLLVIGFKGFVIGFTVGLLIEEFRFWGILIFIFGIFPQNIIIVPAFILGSVVSLNFALSFLKNRRHKAKEPAVSKRFLVYSGLFGFILMFILFACLIESYLAPFFIRIISSKLI